MIWALTAVQDVPSQDSVFPAGSGCPEEQIEAVVVPKFVGTALAVFKSAFSLQEVPSHISVSAR